MYQSNDLLTVRAWPSLVFFLSLFVGVYRAARSYRRRTATVPALRDLFLLAEGLEVTLVVFAVDGMFHPVAYRFYSYCMAGLAVAARTATVNAISSLSPSQAVPAELISRARATTPFSPHD